MLIKAFSNVLHPISNPYYSLVDGISCFDDTVMFCYDTLITTKTLVRMKISFLLNLRWRLSEEYIIADYTLICILKVLGKSVGLCKTTKREDQLLYISLLVSVWRIICENFQPKRTRISWDMNENINKENKKEFWFWRSVTVTLSHHYHR